MSSGPAIGGDEVNALVLDTGTYQVKAGYAGEDTPKFIFPSAVGVQSEAMEVDGESSRPPYAAGYHSVNCRKDGREIVSAFNKAGVLSDMDAVEALWSHALRDQMRADPTEHPILLSEPSHNSKKAREEAVEMIFEKFGSPAVFMAKNAVLSSFAMGRQTSLVMDCGHDGITVAAVHDGYVLNKSVTRFPIGGLQLTKLLRQSIESKGTTMYPPYAFKRIDKGGHFETLHLEPPNTTQSFKDYALDAIAAEVKHSLCRVSDAPFDPEENANIPTVSYELPDGQEISVGAPRFSVPEVLFNPRLLSGFGDVGAALIKDAGGLDAIPSLHAAVNDSIIRCDVDVRRELYGGVIMSGGTSLFGTLRDRVERELTDIAPQMARVKVVSPTNSVERRFSTWIGGSILASLGTFQQMWMSKFEYQELGAGCIHKKAP